MEKSGGGNKLVCFTIIVSVGIITYGIISFGKSIERSCGDIRSGMVHLRPSTASIPNHITLKVSSDSIEKASRNIADGMKNSSKVNIPSKFELELDSGNYGLR